MRSPCAWSSTKSLSPQSGHFCSYLSRRARLYSIAAGAPARGGARPASVPPRLRPQSAGAAPGGGNRAQARRQRAVHAASSGNEVQASAGGPRTHSHGTGEGRRGGPARRPGEKAWRGATHHLPSLSRHDRLRSGAGDGGGGAAGHPDGRPAGCAREWGGSSSSCCRRAGGRAGDAFPPPRTHWDTRPRHPRHTHTGTQRWTRAPPAAGAPRARCTGC